MATTRKRSSLIDSVNLPPPTIGYGVVKDSSRLQPTFLSRLVSTGLLSIASLLVLAIASTVLFRTYDEYYSTKAEMNKRFNVLQEKLEELNYQHDKDTLDLKRMVLSDRIARLEELEKRGVANADEKVLLDRARAASVSLSTERGIRLEKRSPIPAPPARDTKVKPE